MEKARGGDAGGVVDVGASISSLTGQASTTAEGNSWPTPRSVVNLTIVEDYEVSTIYV